VKSQTQAPRLVRGAFYLLLQPCMREEKQALLWSARQKQRRIKNNGKYVLTNPDISHIIKTLDILYV
jgi:hypothetical protein